MKYLVHFAVTQQGWAEIVDANSREDAKKKGIWDLNIIDITLFSEKNKRVDDTPFGGGPGMVIRPDVIENALDSISSKSTNVSKIFLINNLIMN